MAKSHDQTAAHPDAAAGPQPARKVKNPDAVAIDRICEILEGRPAENRQRILSFVNSTYAPPPADPETPY